MYTSALNLSIGYLISTNDTCSGISEKFITLYMYSSVSFDDMSKNKAHVIKPDTFRDCFCENFQQRKIHLIVTV